MKKKCLGFNQAGNVCPKAGTCALAKAYDSNLVIQAPFTMEGDRFVCNEYVILNEVNLGSHNFGNYEQLNS